MRKVAPITALLTVFNGEQFIARAIESVQRQTVQVAEILVVDDGSSDNSSAIARSMGAKVIRQRNKGAPVARTVGVKAASQEWIAFLDHDDLWEPQKIEWQWKAHELCPDAGVIAADFSEFVHGETDLRVASVFSLPEAGLDRLERKRITNSISYLDRVDEQVLSTIYKNIFFPSAILVRRDLAISAGLFQEDIFPMDDIDFFLRCFALSPLAFVERPSMRYRIHPGNSSNNELRMLLSFFKFTERMRESAHLYPPGALNIFTAPDALAQKQYDAARLLMNRGDMLEARRLLTQSLQYRKTLRSATLWILTLFGAASVARLRRAKRLLKQNGK